MFSVGVAFGGANVLLTGSHNSQEAICQGLVTRRLSAPCRWRAARSQATPALGSLSEWMRAARRCWLLRVDLTRGKGPGNTHAASDQHLSVVKVPPP
jgi:hypothetical protein